MKTNIIIISCLIGLTATSFIKSPHGERANFEVIDHIWSTGVDEDMYPIDTLFSDNMTTRDEAWLFVILRGGETELDLLKRESRPVFFKWFRISSYGLTPDRGANQYSNAPSDLHAYDFEELEDEIDEYGYFDIIMSSGSTQMKKRGTYIVKMAYSDNRSLYCEGEPCEFKITIN